MKIFAIMLVKNEADIVKSVILDAKKWADRIFIMDNGSTDGTWEIIQSLADNIVVPWKQDFRPYSNGLRADVFNEFRNEAKDGDWWCFKLDADEFYYDNPKDFLARIPKKYSLVAKQSLDYVLTTEDVEEYDFSGDFEKDKEHIKYLRNTCWSEPRFFRFRKSAVDIRPDQHFSLFPVGPGVIGNENRRAVLACVRIFRVQRVLLRPLPAAGG